jgi:hypothetical protein
MSAKTAAIWAGISAGVMVLGAIGPWATAFGVFSVAGTDGDGVIVLIAGFVVGGMVLLRYLKHGRAWTLVVALLAAAIAAATSIYDMANIQSAISDSHGLVSIGWGLWFDCIASVSAIVALVYLWRASSRTGEDPALERPASPPA